MDVIPKNSYDVNLKQNYSPQKNYESNLNGYSPKHNGHNYPSSSGMQQNGSKNGSMEREHMVPAIRPTQLDLKCPLTKSVKPRYVSNEIEFSKCLICLIFFRMPDPDCIEMCDPLPADGNHSQLVNIAMAIDPTYPRRNLSQTPSSQDTSTSTTSSTTSPAISLPPPGKNSQ